MRKLVLLGALMASLPTAAQAQQPGSEKTPESVIRALVRAMYANDVTAYERLTIPDPRRHRLVSGGSVNEAALKEIEEDPGVVQVKLKSEFRLRGRSVKPASLVITLWARRRCIWLPIEVAR